MYVVVIDVKLFSQKKSRANDMFDTEEGFGMLAWQRIKYQEILSGIKKVVIFMQV